MKKNLEIFHLAMIGNFNIKKSKPYFQLTYIIFVIFFFKLSN